jgi:hypothetical protein
MRHHGLIVLAALALAPLVRPADARSDGRMHVGAMVWRHDTDLQVERATDYDGSDITAGQSVRAWDMTGSGLGARLRYDFPRLLSIYGEAGASQATVRDKDVTDPAQDVTSRGLDNGVYLAAGFQVGDYFSNTGNTFWKLEGSLSSISAGLDRDVFRTWDFDETRIAADGKIGTWVRQIGIYGGLRLVHSNAELRETDRTNLPGQQTRLTELGRDKAVDLLVGAQTRGPEISGFTEIGMVGTFSANAGLMIRF